jgi:hypothetical protein
VKNTSVNFGFGSQSTAAESPGLHGTLGSGSPREVTGARQPPSVPLRRHGPAAVQHRHRERNRKLSAPGVRQTDLVVIRADRRRPLRPEDILDGMRTDRDEITIHIQDTAGRGSPGAEPDLLAGWLDDIQIEIGWSIPSDSECDVPDAGDLLAGCAG